MDVKLLPIGVWKCRILEINSFWVEVFRVRISINYRVNTNASELDYLSLVRLA